MESEKTTNTVSSPPPCRFIPVSDDVKLPVYKSKHAAAADVYAYLPNGPTRIYPDRVTIVPTGLKAELLEDYSLTVCPRSGLSSKGIIVVMGTIDADYKGEIGVLMYTLMPGMIFSHTIEHNDRIAQIKLHKVHHIIDESVRFEYTGDRGEGGFGSTGLK